MRAIRTAGGRRAGVLAPGALLGWVILVVAGATAIVRYDIAQRREAFLADARIAHRLLSQRAAQHDVILATLALLAGSADADAAPERRLPALYPQVLAVRRRDRDAVWPDPALASAERASVAAARPVLGPVDLATGRYVLVLAGEPASYALQIDLAGMVPWDEWPLDRGGAVRVEVEHGGAAMVLQAGQAPADRPFGLTAGFVFEKLLATASQPFGLRLRLATGPAQWPWRWLGVWVAVVSAVLGAVTAWLHARRERRRAEELLRIGRAARLDTLGGIAAGMAHELNQPLAAVLASAGAARRLLEDDPPDVGTAREAVTQAAAQARRAADVVARLRRLVQAPEAARVRAQVDLPSLVRTVLDLLEPELLRRGIETEHRGTAPPVAADPVALEQIVHNLVDNAMRVLESVPPGRRRLTLEVRAVGERAELVVSDTGPGFPSQVLTHVFEPFVSTRPGGLGLGLSLCESLAQAMSGALRAENRSPRGARLTLALPLAGPTP